MKHSEAPGRSRRPATLAMTAGVVAALLTACADSSDGGSGDDGNKRTIAVVAPDVTNATYWASYADAMKDAADEKGVDLIYETGASADDENIRLQSVAGRNPDGIILVPQSTTVNGAGVKSLASSDVPLITSNQFVDGEYAGVDGANPKIHVGFDDFAYGQLQGELLVDACADADPCNVIELDGQLGTSPQIQRNAGIHDVADKVSSITFLTVQHYDWDRGKAATVMASLLSANDDVDVVIAEDDAGALGAATAEEQAGRDDILNIGGGGSEAAIAAVESGDIYGLVWVSPVYDAGIALDAMLSILDDKDPGAEDNQGRPTVPVEVVKVTKDNVADYPAEW